MFFVYILKSNFNSKYYCGQTDNIDIRLSKHNDGLVKSTKHAIPWTLIYKISIETRADAMNLESKIKKRGISRWMKDRNIIH